MARAKQAKSAGAGTPDAITLLKADHRQVEDWFGQFEKARDANRKQNFSVWWAKSAELLRRPREFLDVAPAAMTCSAVTGRACSHDVGKFVDYQILF